MPSRRQLLAASCGLVATLAGCGDDDPGASTGTPTATDGGATAVDDGGSLGLRLDREAYLFRASIVPKSVIGPAAHETTTLGELNAVTRNAVRTAITEGQYTTADPSAALLDGIEHVSLVEFRGTYYEISHTFPTYTLVLERVDADNAPANRTVSRDNEAVRESDAVAAAVSTITPSPSSPGDPYVTTQLSDALRSFLDQYDYLRYPGGVGELVLTTTDRAPPHEVTASEATDERLYGRKVFELDSFSEPTRRLVRDALNTEQKTPLWQEFGTHRLFPEDIPQRLLDAGPLTVTVDGALYSLRADHVHWDDQPFAFTASLLDDSLRADASARIQLAVTNQSPAAAELVMPGVAPFGVLRAYGPGGEQLLWTPEYVERDEVVLEGGTLRPQQRAEVRVDPDERVRTVYEFGWATEQVASGRYVVPGLIWPRWPTEPDRTQLEREWRSERFPYTLTLDVEG